MSHIVITTTDKEFTHYMSKAYADGYAKAVQECQKTSLTDDDTITEAEALQILGCGKSKLAKLRAERKVKFYTISRPYSYSRKSVVECKGAPSV